MNHRGLSDEGLAAKLGVDRVTVTRYRNQQHRLNPDKQAAIAKALDIEPSELWYPPTGRPSIDALLRGAPDEAVEKLAAFAATIAPKGR